MNVTTQKEEGLHKHRRNEQYAVVINNNGVGCSIVLVYNRKKTNLFPSPRNVIKAAVRPTQPTTFSDRQLKILFSCSRKQKAMI